MRAGVSAPRRDRIPVAVLAAIVAVAFFGTAIWVRVIHTFTVMPDELGYVKQSLSIAHSLRPVLPSDFYFSSWGELFPAILAPVFGSMNMVSAFFAAHTVDAFLLASAAIPVFLMALELRLGGLAACLVAALTAAVPWMVFSGLVMTEDLAYPVFLWAVLGSLRSMTAPSARRDVMALAGLAVAFLTRTQFIVLGPILIVAIVVHEVALARACVPGMRGPLAAGLRAAVAHHRLLTAVTAVVVVVLALLTAAGSASSVLGNYSLATGGSLLPPGTLSAGLGQLYDVAFAGGVIPLTLSTAWVAATVGRPRTPERHAFAVLLVVIVAVLLVLLGSFAIRYLVGGVVTDRYMFYVVPLLFLGTAAWVVDDRTSGRVAIAVTTAVTVLVLLETLHYTTLVSILNPSFNTQRLMAYKGMQLGSSLGIAHLDPRIPIAAATAAFTVGVTLLRSRTSTHILLLVVTLPLLVFVGGETIFTMSKAAPDYDAVPAGSPHLETWIDRSVGTGATVGLLLAPSQSEQNSRFTWWTMSFWNKSVRASYALPGSDTFAQGYVRPITPNLATGALDGLGSTGYLVKLTEDARVGLRGSLLASQGGLDLYRLAPSAPLTYSTLGVEQDGSVAIRSGPLIRFFGNGGTPVRERATVTLQVLPPAPDCPCSLYTGVRHGGVSLPTPAPGGTKVVFSRTINLPARGGVSLPLVVRGRTGRDPQLGMSLVSVRITRP